MGKEEVTEKYEKHLKTQHGVCYNRSWLIEQTLAVTNPAADTYRAELEETKTGTKVSSDLGETEVDEIFVTAEEEAERNVAFEAVSVMEVDPLDIMSDEKRRKEDATRDKASHSAKSNCDLKRKYGIKNFDENENIKIDGRKGRIFTADKIPFENLVKSALRRCSVKIRNHHLEQFQDEITNFNTSCPSNEQNLEVDPNDEQTDMNSNVITGADFLDSSFESISKKWSREIKWRKLSNVFDGCDSEILEKYTDTLPRCPTRPPGVPRCFTPPTTVPKCPASPSPPMPSYPTSPSVPRCPTPPTTVPRCPISPSPVLKCSNPTSTVPKCPTPLTNMTRCPPPHRRVLRYPTPPSIEPGCSTPLSPVPRCSPRHSSRSTDKYEYKCPFPGCDFQTDLEGMKTGAAAEHGMAVHQVRPWEVKKHGLKWKRVSLEKRQRQMFGDA